MCADWQGTRLAVNQQMPSLTVITEAGAAAQTPFLTVFWEVKSDFKISFTPILAFVSKFLGGLVGIGRVWGTKALAEKALRGTRGAR